MGARLHEALFDVEVVVGRPFRQDLAEEVVRDPGHEGECPEVVQDRRLYFLLELVEQTIDHRPRVHHDLRCFAIERAPFVRERKNAPFEEKKNAMFSRMRS